MVILYTNGNSEDSRKKILKKVGDLESDNIHIVPLSVSAKSTDCFTDPMCPDARFLNAIKDRKLETFLDSTKGLLYLLNVEMVLFCLS